MSRKSPTPGADPLPGLALPVQHRDRRTAAQRHREPTIMDWLKDRDAQASAPTLHDQHLVR